MPKACLLACLLLGRWSLSISQWLVFYSQNVHCSFIPYEMKYDLPKSKAKAKVEAQIVAKNKPIRIQLQPWVLHIFFPQKWPLHYVHNTAIGFELVFYWKSPLLGTLRSTRIHTHTKKLSNDLGSIHLEVTSYGLRKTGLNSLEGKKK